MELPILRQLRWAMTVMWILFLAMKALACNEEELTRKCKHPEFWDKYPSCNTETCEPCSNICWSDQTNCAKWIFLNFCLGFVTSAEGSRSTTISISSAAMSGTILRYFADSYFACVRAGDRALVKFCINQAL